MTIATASDMTFSPLPTVSYNTASIIRFRNFYKTGTSQVVLQPEGVGTRFIITALRTLGRSVEIGFGTIDAGVITESLFTYSQAAGPVDLSEFFSSAPFCHYRPGKELVINFEGGATGTVAYVPYKG
jgi:hypothetical protein